VLAVADDLARKSQIEDAIALYASLAAADPQDARPEIGWAWALIYDDEPEQALVHARRGAELDAANPDAWAVLSRASAGAGELQVAAAIQPQLWLRRHKLGLMLSAAGDPRTAALAFEDALALRPKAESYAGLGEARYQLEEYGLAQEALTRAITMGLEDAVAYGVLAASYAHLGQCDEAGRLAQMALALDPGQPYAAEAVGLCPGAP
jgi:tetratricopeptide (TPR) repeat protein